MGTPRLVALSPEQEREAVTLLGQLLLDAAGKRAAGVSASVSGSAYPGAFGVRPQSPRCRERRTGTHDPTS